MAEPKTIAKAVEQVALGMVQTSSENGRALTHISIDDLIAADQHRAGKVAARKQHFGLRFTKCIPPGGG